MNSKELKIQQSSILSNIYSTKEFKHFEPVQGVLSEIRKHSNEFVLMALKDSGVKLKQFSSRIDLSHPDIIDIMSGEFVSLEYHSLNQYCLNMFNIVSSLTKRFAGGFNDELCLKKFYIDDPFVNHQYIRLVADRKDRDHLRSFKVAQKVDLTLLYESDSFLIKNPSNYKTYFRFCNPYEKDAKRAQSSVAFFEETGLVSIVNQVKSNVKFLQLKNLTDKYHGFNKISLLTCTGILSKMLDYSFSKRTRKFANKEHKDWSPIAVPLWQLIDSASAEMVQLVEFLEAYPEIGGKALFDNYRILKNENDDPAIFLGERDGCHYFISYWM